MNKNCQVILGKYNLHALMPLKYVNNTANVCFQGR